MRRYFSERTINQVHRDVDLLYNRYKNKFDSFQDLVDYIAKTLYMNKYTILQILELVEKDED